MRLGYLVPEFPGQTHTFFRRELEALGSMGVDAQVVSTRKPPPGRMAHAWSKEWMSRTTYLFPPGVGGVGKIIAGLVWAGPVGLARAVGAVMSCEKKLRPFALIGPALQLRHLARSRGWTHLHAHSCGDAAHLAMLCRRLGGPTYSVTLHGPLKDYGPNQPTKWRHAAFGIVITKKLLAELQAELGAACPATLKIAPMGVEMKRFARPSAAPYQPWRGEGQARLFCCARLNRVKGHAELVEAVKMLRDRGLDVHLEIAGQDDKGGSGYRVELQKLIDDTGLAEHVKLLGPIDEEKVVAGLHDAHVFVLASHHEPLGVALMEAMAATTPIVSTDAGGVPELISNGHDGILVEARSAEALAAGIERLIRDPDLALTLVANAYQTVSRSFHSGVSAEVLVNAIAESRPPSAAGDYRNRSIHTEPTA